MKAERKQKLIKEIFEIVINVIKSRIFILATICTLLLQFL